MCPKSRCGRRLGISGNHYILIIGVLVLVGVSIVWVANSGPKKQVANIGPSSLGSLDSLPAVASIPEGWVNIGGVYRPKTDVALNQPSVAERSSKSTDLEYGKQSKIEISANASTRSISEALKNSNNPERLSPFFVGATARCR